MKISSGTRTSDPIFDSKLTATTVQKDLLLLENQIPFFVLEKLFRLTVDRIPNNRPHMFSLTYYVSLYFGNIMSPEESSTNSSAAATSCGSPSDTVLWISGNKIMKSSEEDEVLTNASYYHILHKIHEDYRPHNPADQIENKELSEFMPCASELDYAGVKFVHGTGKDLLEVKFTEPKGPFWWCQRAHFEIPTLPICDPTEPFLRNLIAFEQCYPGVSQHFTSYAFLMGMLVNSDKDVELLKKAGVLCNYLGGSEDSTDLFDNLCKEVVLGEFFFADTCNRAIEYSERFWQKNLRGIKRTYFDHPWTLIAFCLSIIPFGMILDSDFDVSSCGFGYSDVVGFAEMKMSIDKAQKCYAEDVMLDEEMMLVDGCFILEHLYIFYESKNIPKEEDRTRRKAYRRIYIIFTSFVSPFTGTFNKTLCRQANKERGREISDT
ncbi:hypothetical protein C3L33_20414, partial [Rhododendron williamsianum]